MRSILLISTIFVVQLSFGQLFSFRYWNVGLRSNASWHMSEEDKDCAAGLIVEIRDSVLFYSKCERNGEFMFDSLLNDTIWIIERTYHKTAFRQSSIDSIVSY